MSEPLAAFGGFHHEEFREHDYLLGRRNCQRLLARHFNLPDTNPLFDSWRDDPTLSKSFVVNETVQDEGGRWVTRLSNGV